MTQILAFPDSIDAATRLATQLQVPLDVIDVHRFPDGESLVTIPDQMAKTVIFFRSLHDPNAKLIELLLAIETARQNGCKRVILITPYLCYMRQDMAFKPGQAVSQRIIGQMLSEWVDDLITVDPHLHRISHLNMALPYCNSVCATATTALGQFLRTHTTNALLVGPDEESRQWVQQVAEVAGLDFAVASKERFGDRDVRVTLPNVDVKGRHTVLVDDVISSGRTMIETAHALLASGASNVSAICTHALFAEGALAAMQDAGIDPIWSSDAIPHPSNAVDLTPALLDALRDITGNSS